eukprot:4191580-Amphidinium_carterae.1
MASQLDCTLLCATTRTGFKNSQLTHEQKQSGGKRKRSDSKKKRGDWRKKSRSPNNSGIKKTRNE